MFRPLLLGHHQVTGMNFEEAVQYESKNKEHKSKIQRDVVVVLVFTGIITNFKIQGYRKRWTGF